jgi:hypothetical protein
MKPYLCNVNFQSQYAFVNDKCMHISECNQSHKSYLKCQNGHELIPVNPKKRKPHFRHKNTEDCSGNPMTLWHAEWQGNFPITEQVFKCKPTQNKERRADVVLNNNTVLEIQHSKYDRIEIDNRKHDYSLHDVSIIWLVDGSGSIIVNNLTSVNRVFLEFTSEHWKYENFKSYDYIYIDINQQIYKINPNNIKSHMIDVESPKLKEDFIYALKNNIDLWNNEKPNQCNLYIKQQGAGNGKTFGIIKMLEDDDKLHYKNFIFITKQHSAKHIIKSEFESQMNSFTYFKNIEIIESNKKYIIKYFNEKSGINCQIIISTIDSFTYSLGNKDHNELDKFQGLINSIIDGHIESNESGVIKFGGINSKLNKETLLVIDEFQDPPDCYAKAIIRIMREKYIDVYVVGDRLQSISNEKNAFLYFWQSELPNINTIKLTPTNICRRFSHSKLVDFVNFMIPFEKYELPKITPYKLDNTISNPLIFFKGDNTIYADESDKDKISKEVNKIMKYYEEEVLNGNRYPEDFLIVTLFTQKNPLVDALLLAINIFWREKFINEQEYFKNWNDNNVKVDDYYNFAIFHKSEEGSSINLSESDKSTRIVSCHSSKGDGRPVVFLISFTEKGIERFSRTNNNLVYDSLLHVGLTRMKEKLYIRFEENNDDIHKKIKEYLKESNIYDKEVKPNIRITSKIKYQDLVKNIALNNFEEIYCNFIKDSQNEKLVENKDKKKLIDTGHHNIRYATLFITTIIEIINQEKYVEDTDIKKQIKAIFYTVSEAHVCETLTLKKYLELLQNKQDKVIPILKISNKGNDYLNYFNIIMENVINLQEKIRNFLKNNCELNLCTLECILFYFMFEIVNEKTYSSITISDVYDIVDLYFKNFDSSFIGHEHCLCKKLHLKYCNNCNLNIKNNDLTEYLKNHYEKIRNIKNIVKNIFEKYPKMNWLISHNCYYDGNDSFNIKKKFLLIGYNDTTTITCYIKPQFNSLNYNNILVESIYDEHLLNNIKNLDNEGNVANNYIRFKNKTRINCVLTLDLDKPYYISCPNSNNTNLIINFLHQEIFNKYITDVNEIFYFYAYWRKFCPEDKKSSINFIEFINEKVKENENKNAPIIYPKFIYDFFKNIEFELNHTKGKNNKELILKNYDDKLYFTKQLEEILNIEIKKYLKISIDDDEDEE